MFLAKISVRRSVLMTMVILLFVVIGAFSYTRLSQDLIPEIDFPFIMVTTIYPGAGPKEVESQVTEKLEEEISGVSRLENITSSSREGMSLIFIEFELGTDVDIAAIDVKDKVDAIRYDLPDEAEDPSIQKFDINEIPVIDLALYGSLPLEDIYEIADRVVKEEISRVDGVSSVELIGGKKREIRVACSREKLRAYGLSIMEVFGLIGAENLNVPAGRITEERSEISLRMLGEFEDLEALRDMRIPLHNGGVIRLREVAKVIDTFEEQRDQARFEGKYSVGIVIQKKADANTVDTADGIYEALEKVERYIPEGVEIAMAQDRSTFIRESVRDVFVNIIIGILLTGVLLYLFLHDMRATLIVAIAMPTSVIATFSLMYAAGFTLNVISLMGLGISIGILVTNAIVVLENISRHMTMKEDPGHAAEVGTSEIAVAVIASVMTNIVVFTPIAFMKGIIGQFFYQFGLTVVFATIFSLVVSFTLTPMLASKFLKTGHKRAGWSPWGVFARGWEKAYRSIEESYTNTLRWSLSHRWVTVVLTVLSFVGGLMLFGWIGMEFFPSSDEGLIEIEVKLPAGTSLVQTDKVLMEMEALIRTIPEVDTILSKIGGSRQGVEDGELSLKLVDAEERERDVFTIIDQLRPMLAVIPAAEITVGSGGRGPGGGYGDIEIDVSGPELDGVRELSDTVAEIVRGIEGLADVRTTYVSGRPEMTFLPDRHHIASYGLTTGQVAQVLRTSFEGEVASNYREGGEEYDIRVQLDEKDRSKMDSARDLLIATPKGFVPLSQLGDFYITKAETEIQHKNKQRMIVVSANIARGKLGGKVEEIRQQTDALKLEDRYSIYFGGQSEAMQENFGYIFQALILAIILTYMVLAAILESYIHPFTIMITLPLGLIGVALALFLTGESINMISLMAVVMLVGIVVNNAILILDYTAQLRKEGKPIKEALIEASTVRLRPIVMTNLAIALSILPQALAGAGSEFRAAVAIVTMGGVLVSAIFTLYLIPAIYTAMDRLTLASLRGSGKADANDK